MDQHGLWFILLLQVFLCLSSEDTGVTIKKTIGREPDTTPICTNDPVNFITMIICKIKTATGESCRLLYRPEHGLNEDCDSRFRLLNEYQLFFLHLTSLTPGDSGHYTCECSRTDGVYTVQLQVTVEAPFISVYQPNLILIFILISVFGFFLMSGAIVGFTLCRICCRQNTRTNTSVPPLSLPLSPLDQEEQENPYESLQQPASDVYQTISLENTKSSNTGTGDGEEIYENS